MRTILLLLCSIIAQAALPNNTTTWEVRPTVGANTNGGCFITGASGTDFSQQNAAQYNNTDLVLATSTTLTSATHNFVASDVGNCIHITAGTGFTQGFYQILSVAANVATIDRSAGTGGSTGGTFAVGGALADVATATGNSSAGNTIYVKATGTLTVTTTTTITLNSGGNNPLRITGYTTTRTDGGRFTWTTATNSIALVTLTGATGVWIQNVNFTNTAGTRAAGLRATSTESNQVAVVNCSFDGMSRGVSAGWPIESSTIRELLFQNSEVKNSTTQGIDISGYAFIIGSYIHDNTGNGIFFDANANGFQVGVTVAYSIIKSNTTSGLQSTYTGVTNGQSAQIIVFNSDFVSNGADGIRFTAGDTTANGLQSYNNIFDSNTGYGINYAGGGQLGTCAVVANAFFNNSTSTTTGLATDCISASVTLTGTPFTNAAGNNFALNNTSGAGAAAKSTGYPGVLVIGGTGFMSIGPLQPQAGGGASGAGFVQ